MSSRLNLLRSSDSAQEEVEMSASKLTNSTSFTDIHETITSMDTNEPEVNSRKSSDHSIDDVENDSATTSDKSRDHQTEINETGKDNKTKNSEKGKHEPAETSEKGKHDPAETSEKGKDDSTKKNGKDTDNADGYDPFSQDSLLPLTSGNQYSLRKTASQALMDVALMMANISQLRTLLTAGDKMEYSIVLIVMVSLSLAMQVLFAILISLIWVREGEQHQKDEYLKTLRELQVTEIADGKTTTITDKIRNSRLRREMSYKGHIVNSHLNYITMVLVFIITVINMFITGFGIKLESGTDSDSTHSPS